MGGVERGGGLGNHYLQENQIIIQEEKFNVMSALNKNYIVVSGGRSMSQRTRFFMSLFSVRTRAYINLRKVKQFFKSFKF